MNLVNFKDSYNHINTMDNTNDETRLIGECIREDSEEEEIFEDLNDNTIYEEELKNTHPDLDHNFSSSTMNSGHMNVHHNDPDKFIGYPEYFHYYFI